jgi:PhnB protein
MYIPPGFNTVFPYFFVDDADAFARFLVEGLGGLETGRTVHGGRIANVMVQLGTSTIMASEASVDFPAMPASYYLYVEDAHAAMKRALQHGAVEISPVGDRPYGDRQGGVKDAFGNLWWLTQRTVQAPY